MSVSTQRYLEPDALRGFAVMGILWVNIYAFALPDMAFISPAIGTEASGGNIASWIASFILFDGKMRSLFSLLFGASMMLVVERAATNGQSPARVHYSRMFWLALFGLAHFFLIWWGDILFLYAFAGCMVFFMRNWAAKRLIKFGAIAYAVGAVLLAVGLGSIFLAQANALQPGASAETVSEYKEIIVGFGASAADISNNFALYRGSFAEILNEKLSERLFDPLESIILSAIETIPLMMIGMGLFKNGFLLGEWPRAQYVRIASIAMTIGVLCFGGLAAVAVTQEYDTVWIMNITQAWSALPRLIMTIGYIAMFILLIDRFRDSQLILRVASAGRMAFSNYLGTSIVMTAIFYGWGLGLFGRFDRGALMLFAAGGCMLMLLWSKPWLERFRYGPLEWLWRSLARWKFQAMRKD